MRNSSVSVIDGGRWMKSLFVPSDGASIHNALVLARIGCGAGVRLVVQFPFWKREAIKEDADLRRMQLVNETAMRWVACGELLRLPITRVFARTWTNDYVAQGEQRDPNDGLLLTHGLASRLTGRPAGEIPPPHADSICVAYWAAARSSHSDGVERVR
jgi:hypothetical protein